MKRKQLLFLLALLMTAATGAWAQSAKHLITATYDKQTRLLEQPLPYETTVGALYEAVTGKSISDLLTIMTALETPLSEISSGDPSVVSIGEFNDASTPVTVKADGEATVRLTFGTHVKGIFVSVVPPLYVTMADGTEDAGKWTATVGTSTNAQALPVGGLSEKDAVTLTYGGRLKVKSVTATTDAAAPSVPDGAISGVFSVSSTKKVYFSKGNLQATYYDADWSDGTPGTWTWAFAANQWDYSGNAAGNTSIDGDGTISENATVDLFGWVGANCDWTGAAQYGISNVTQAAQYGNVEGEALKSDWGTLAITNGGNTANFGWHSLASSEWEYLFQTRTTPSGVSYAHATVNDVPGLVLLPDDWSNDYYSLNKVNNTTGTAYTDNVISSSDWTSKLEAHGAVFLPAGGYRSGASVSDAGDKGNYWSSTPGTTAQSALGFFFGSARFVGITQNFMRPRGCSVRLVYEVATSDAPAEATPALNLTSPAVGQVIGDDGQNYDYGSLPTGVTAVAKICYVSGSNGLALALTDEANTMNWSTAISTCAAHTPAFTGGTWKLATKDEWENMIGAAGLSNLGFQGYHYYWSSTEYNADCAWSFFSYSGSWDYNGKGSGDIYVRACLAF